MGGCKSKEGSLNATKPGQGQRTMLTEQADSVNPHINGEPRKAKPSIINPYVEPKQSKPSIINPHVEPGQQPMQNDSNSESQRQRMHDETSHVYYYMYDNDLKHMKIEEDDCDEIPEKYLSGLNWIDEMTRVRIVDGVVGGLYRLRRKEIAHLAIRPDNFMLSKEGLLILATYKESEVIFDSKKPGYKKNVDFDRLLGRKEGINYLAPQCLGDDRMIHSLKYEQFLHKIDIWSGGSTLLEALSTYPFSRGLTLNFTRHSQQNHYRFHLLNYITAEDEQPPRSRVEYDVLISMMLVFDPANRIAGEQLHRLWLLLRKRILKESEDDGIIEVELSGGSSERKHNQPKTDLHFLEQPWADVLSLRHVIRSSFDGLTKGSRIAIEAFFRGYKETKAALVCMRFEQIIESQYQSKRYSKQQLMETVEVLLDAKQQKSSQNYQKFIHALSNLMTNEQEQVSTAFLHYYNVLHALTLQDEQQEYEHRHLYQITHQDIDRWRDPEAKATMIDLILGEIELLISKGGNRQYLGYLRELVVAAREEDKIE